MITVMVTGVGSNIGQGIVKALRMSDIDVKIIGTDMVSLSAGLFRCDKGYVTPSVSSETCLERIIDICRKESIDIIFIGSNPELVFFSKNKAIIEDKTNTKILVNNTDFYNIFTDKLETINFLMKNKLDYPESSLNNQASIQKLIEKVGYPLLIKPRFSSGSRGIFIINNRKELDSALIFVSDPVIQEYIEGDEFTSGVFFDKDSEIKGIISMKRDLSYGTTYRSIVDVFPEIESDIRSFAEVLSKHGAIGPINIQSKFISGKTYTIEVNPRFSGTTVFRANHNFNEPEAAIKHFLMGEDIQKLNPSKGIVMRYWDEIYTSFEDWEKIKHNGFIENSSSLIRKDF